MRNPTLNISPSLPLSSGEFRFVAATSRLASELRYAYDTHVMSSGVSAWHRPHIASFSQWCAEQYQQLSFAEPNTARRSLISNEAFLLIVQRRSPDQEVTIHASGIVAAWQEAWDWNLWPDWQDVEETENGTLCAAWFRRIRRYLNTHQLVTSSELPNLLLTAVERTNWKPDPIVLLEPDNLTRSQENLLNRLDSLGLVDRVSLDVPTKTGSQTIVGHETERHELAALAMWSRDKLSSLGETASIGIVVHGLERRYSQLLRQFENTFPEVHDISRVVSFESGTPLTDTTLYRDLRTLLNWTLGPVEIADLLLLTNSAYFPKLDFNHELHKNSFHATRANLRQFSKRVSGQAKGVLQAISDLVPQGTRSPMPFARAAKILLDLIRSCGYSEHEVKPYEHIDEAAVDVLGDVLSSMSRMAGIFPRISWIDYINLLDLFAREHRVLVSNLEAPIQVLGRDASRHLHFDALWITGMSDEDFPGSPNPSPFLPKRMQREAQMPRITHEQMLDYGIEQVKLWRESASEVVFSFFDETDSITAQPSEILTRNCSKGGEMKVRSSALSAQNDHFVQYSHPWSASPANLIPTAEFDQDIPPVDLQDIRPKTSLVRHQTECLFKAYGIHRMDIREPEKFATMFPDAAARGTLFHNAAPELIKPGMSDQDIKEITTASIEAAVDKALNQEVETKHLPLQFRQNELDRVKALIERLIATDIHPGPYKVVATETAVEIELGGLTFHGRVDRIDDVEGIGKVLLDYKTSGLYTPKSWDPKKLTDAQMPMYALSDQDSKGVAYVVVSRDQCKTMGCSEANYGIRKQPLNHSFEEIASYEKLKSAWRTSLENTFSRYLNYEGQVNPIDPKVCEYCHLQNMCRIFESTQYQEPDREGVA